MKKIISLVLGHKIIALIFLAIIIIGSYFGWRQFKIKNGAASYITQPAKIDMLITSISGTGQVSALSQVDIKPKATGNVTLVNVINGQTVKEGDLLAQIDSREAAIQVNEAKAAYDNAKLDLDELLSPTDKTTLIQAQNALADAEDSLIKLKTTQANNYQNALDSIDQAESDLENSYEDAYNDVSNVFLDYPEVMSDLYTILYSREIADSETSVANVSNSYALLNSFFSRDDDKKTEFQKYMEAAFAYYEEAESAYEPNFNNYRDANRYSSHEEIYALILESIETTKKIADTIKSENNAINYWVNYRSTRELSIFSKVTQYQANLSSYTSKINSHLTSLLSAKKSIDNYITDIEDLNKDLADMKQNQPLDLAASERSLQEKKDKVADLEAGATTLEIQNKQLTVQQKQNALWQAQQDWAEYYVRAPFDGTIAALNIAKGDSLSSGTTVATVITNQKIATITLNEIDAAKVKVGQKVNLTFDAVTDLDITGKVAEVDTLGTVTQGVVSYDIKIIFDVQDERIKPGMSVSVSIIVEAKTGVLIVPISAVKNQGTASYVEILVDGAPQRQTVTTGLSNDTMIEITSGLNEGDEVIVQTIDSSKTTTNSSSSQNNRQTSGFGGEIRMLR